MFFTVLSLQTMQTQNWKQTKTNQNCNSTGRQKRSSSQTSSPNRDWYSRQEAPAVSKLNTILTIIIRWFWALRPFCFHYATACFSLSWTKSQCIRKHMFDLCVCFPELCSRILPLLKHPECTENTRWHRKVKISLFTCANACLRAFEHVWTMKANRLRERVTKYWNITQCWGCWSG